MPIQQQLLGNIGGVNYPQTMGIFLDTNTGYTPSQASWQHGAARHAYVMFQGYGGIEQFQGITYAALMSGMKSYAQVSLNGHVLKTGFYQMEQEFIQST